MTMMFDKVTLLFNSTYGLWLVTCVSYLDWSASKSSVLPFILYFILFSCVFVFTFFNLCCKDVRVSYYCRIKCKKIKEKRRCFLVLM